MSFARPPAPGPAISVCICTRNRPADLAATLRSVGDSPEAVQQVVVSDDSDDPTPARDLIALHPGVTLVRGPRAGLGANRNRALTEVRGDLVVFLDDDCHLGPRFVGEIRERAVTYRNTYGRLPILTGTEDRRGEIVRGADQDFLGFHRRSYETGHIRHTVVINAAAFPAELFESVRFDPQLRYGYDEVDIATRAVAAGYEIVEHFSAVNYHFPSPINREEYDPYTEASRVYVTFKRWWTTRDRPPMAIMYLAVALLHVFASNLRRSGWNGMRSSARTARLAGAYIRRYFAVPGIDRAVTSSPRDA